VPFAAASCPSAHAAHDVLSAVDAMPTSHARHPDAAGVAENVPVAQAAQLPAPGAEYFPGTHATHGVSASPPYPPLHAHAPDMAGEVEPLGQPLHTSADAL